MYSQNDNNMKILNRIERGNNYLQTIKHNKTFKYVKHMSNNEKLLANIMIDRPNYEIVLNTTQAKAFGFNTDYSMLFHLDTRILRDNGPKLSIIAVKQAN